MGFADHWLLPEGMDEVPPPQARRIEKLRRQLLDLFHTWGYELILPPPVEFLESLLTGAGHDLDLQTFKVTDQLTGRMMGVSADVTPQVARMDAHSLPTQGVARFCYSAQVLRTRADNPLGSRSPIQIGAELFGHAGLESDLEILCLLLDSLLSAGAEQLCLDLGQVSIYRSLVAQAHLSLEVEEKLFDLLQHKRLDELDRLFDLLQGVDALPPELAALKHLARLNGGLEVLDQAEAVLAKAPDAVHQALAELRQLTAALSRLYPQVDLYLDLSELRGYHYHTGLVFAAYVPQLGQALAKGGRYDAIGAVFGRSRSATGFSTDLKVLASLRTQPEESEAVFLAPPACFQDPQGRDLVQKLRAQGQRVVLALTEEATHLKTLGHLDHQQGVWQLIYHQD